MPTLDSALKNDEPENSNNSMKRLLTTKEVAVFLQISPQRVYTLCSTQKFPHIKVSSRRIRFDRDAVRDWLDARSQGEVY